MDTVQAENILVSRLKNLKTKQEAWSDLVHQFQECLYWHIRKMVVNHDDARDVLQEVFIRAWKGIENYRGDSNLSVWLYRIATNETFRFLEKKKKKSGGVIDLEDMLVRDLETGPWIDGDEVQKKLQKVILSLPEKQRMVFNMRYFDEMPYENISKIMDISVESLKVSYHVAKKKITALLEL